MTYSLSTTWLVDNPDDALDCTPAQVEARIAVYRTAPPAYNDEMVDQYINEGLQVARLARGRASLGFSQSLHETAGLRYGGQVEAWQFNFGGLGATNDGAAGASFQTIRHGWMAFWAHHMSYWWGALSNWPAWAETFKAHAFRNSAVLSAGYGGTVTTVGSYTNGKWAWSPQYPKGTLQNGYAQAIVSGANFIRAFPTGDTPEPPKEEPPVNAQIPGFTWHPADLSHYAPGRTAKVRGGAQHYTAGTNSLNWLSTTPGSRVSAHFLVKHNPTMNNRGWQLVRLQDTAWTTAFANPYTVSIEYEHTGKGPIPDIAYDVLVQTWKDIDVAVKAMNLGAIDTIAGHKTWVNNPQLICPDGIDVERIVKGVYEPKPAPTPPPGPALPSATKDPYGSPWGEFWILNPFLDDIKKHDWLLTGHVRSGAFLEDGLLVQYFERARLELAPNGTVTRGLVGGEVLAYRHPGLITQT